MVYFRGRTRLCVNSSSTTWSHPSSAKNQEISGKQVFKQYIPHWLTKHKTIHNIYWFAFKMQYWVLFKIVWCLGYSFCWVRMTTSEDSGPGIGSGIVSKCALLLPLMPFLLNNALMCKRCVESMRCRPRIITYASLLLSLSSLSTLALLAQTLELTLFWF